MKNLLTNALCKVATNFFISTYSFIPMRATFGAKFAFCVTHTSICLFIKSKMHYYFQN